MIAPTLNPLVVSPFGERHIPETKIPFHRGVDLRCYLGNEVVAPEDLRVLRSGKGDFGENFIVAKGRETGFVHKFMHCKPIGCKAGIIITEGAVIATSDSSGTKDAHLHWEIWTGEDGWAGKPVDPIENYLKRYSIAFNYKEGLNV